MSQQNSFSHALFFIKQYKQRYGFEKFIRAFLHYFYRVLKKPTLSSDNIVNVNGYRISLIPEDQGISKELLMFRIHEPISTKLISNTVKKGMTCLDIGANIGYYVLLESNIVGNEGMVIAIEPSPLNFMYLKKNLELDKRKNVKVFNFAAGDKKGDVRFFLNERSNGCKVLAEGEDPPPRKIGKIINVPVKKMDDLVDDLNLEKIDYIRMDVEGYELQIFQGMKKTLGFHRPQILLEVHTRQMGVKGTKEFFNLLQDLKYEVKSYHPRDLDVPIIGTMKDIKKFKINDLLKMFDGELLPGFFNLMLVPEST